MSSQAITNAWFKYCTIRSRPRLRLFCFPHAGGGASQFRLWGEELPEYIEVYPVQLPGREERFGERPFTEFSRLLPSLKAAIFPYIDRPFAFLGHSMGALICFELARYLRRCNLPMPRHLFVSAHRAPQLPRRDACIHTLPSAQFIQAIDKLAGTPLELLNNAEAMETFLPLLRADFTLCETYTYTQEEPLPASLSACGGMMDDSVSSRELDAWRAQTTSAFNLLLFPGAHFYLQSKRTLFLQFLSSRLDTLLREMK